MSYSQIYVHKIYFVFFLSLGDRFVLLMPNIPPFLYIIYIYIYIYLGVNLAISRPGICLVVGDLRPKIVIVPCGMNKSAFKLNWPINIG